MGGICICMWAMEFVPKAYLLLPAIPEEELIFAQLPGLGSARWPAPPAADM